ncbi:MAG: hypothetical protein ABUT20_28880 [Bacteroidota bacterium]
MKKYSVVNSQEDEDGSVLYPGNTIFNKNNMHLQEINIHDKTANKKPDSIKMYFKGKTFLPGQAKRMNEK